ncbi:MULTISPECIES: flagellin N-terminal helical domain-containing protein [unclassified Rhizobium]|uniref:flagellin N-terminal helical domain-containing protein n=1 Tax=unclassified Rhizobium TaxID=2613769 RepID=UPI001ADC4886|nr:MULTISPECIES: flagellin [unclassified Rhizobium]MBO9096587.1 flagellin [Rhizobium sp. L58/93]MBO9166843.1 flagellin [Rhizobium sp. L245/93]MBO9182815.1 flagellin [Rhizobium sp. E27B/91]QXZ82714.1 flagellin [Rhizobium sp. K1/93]QXZ89773.1 flagellin [Rhizobium sp. K15/93]
MSSIKTNLSAMAALRTLGSVTQQLTSTEKRVSSGLKVASASDNATYWSVATTMRSDRGATSAVADALGVASATVDTAYAGMTSVLDTLSAFKAKLVTAKEGSVDKSKVQDELDQLKQQVASVATSASFNGVNMLSYSQAANLKTTNSVTTSVPAAFVRSADGTVSISDSDIDMTKTLLFNTGGGGLLQSDSDALGLATLGSFSGGSIGAVAGHQDFNFIGAQTFGASDAVSFDLTLDASDASAGNSYAITIDRSVVTAALGAAANGKIANGQDMAAVLNKAFQLAGAPASSGGGTSSFEIATRHATGLAGSSVSTSNLVSSLSGGSGLGLESAPTASVQNVYPQVDFSFGSRFAVPEGQSFSFSFAIDGSSQQTISVDRATVDAALGTSANGIVSTADDMAAVLGAAGQQTGLLATASGGSVTLSGDKARYPTAGVGMTVSAPQKHTAGAIDFNFTDIDITTAGADVDYYISGLDAMQNRVTAAAALLGSLQSSIGVQSDFAKTLMDSIDRGVGRLVDADMETESSKLAAQQTQQQLAVQSLSIANQAPQRLLSLFRG